MESGDFAPEEPIGADDDGLALVVAHVAVDHQEVIADRVVFVEVAALAAHLRRGGAAISS